MVGLGGLEPPTSHLSGAHSNQLSYRPIAFLKFEAEDSINHLPNCQLRFYLNYKHW